MEQTQTYFLYIGTYTSEHEPGIFVYRLDAHTGKVTFIEGVAGITNPSYIAIDRQRPYLYAVSEMQTFEGQQGGAVGAFTRDPQSGTCSIINKQPTGGADPCYISIDPTGKILLSVNYTGGSISAYPLAENGAIEERSDFVRHEGQGIRPDRQEGPHPHSVVFDPSGLAVLVADLGLDTIFVYKIDPATTTYVLHGKATVAAGAGPRHTIFSTKGDRVYCINELNGTIDVFDYDTARAILTHRQTVSTLPAGFTEQNTNADIHISPDGRFLYSSNRGHDSIAVFSIDQQNGELTLLQHISTGGKTPRNFAITPNGQFLLAANQDSNLVVIFRIDQQSGLLAATGDTIEVPHPACIKLQ